MDEKLESVKISDAVENEVDVESDAVADTENQIITELNDKYLRAMAELENTRRRAAMDAAAAARSRGISVAEKFLPLLDAINSALVHNSENADFVVMARAADGALETAGITRIKSVGEKLNPALHNAIQTEKSDMEHGTITQELQSGYTYGDAVLRPAMVVVAE
ncbi:MAG: nucleotide exchange factor GrpE [Rickettsiales bacterium]|jgi:molecular chaperone GrpE|nr:nucleotide exchange factor GrpE [Rickettsiales bacterium]